MEEIKSIDAEIAKDLNNKAIKFPKTVEKRASGTYFFRAQILKSLTALQNLGEKISKADQNMK